MGKTPMDPMVRFDVGPVGPAGDFGSLSAFLGVSSGGHECPKIPKAQGASACSACSALKNVNIEKDNTLLNKKVAFRMLKQLGCEVCKEGEISFVEVSLAKQPVLFKMLVELGHGPCRNQDGDMVVRVKEQRPRKPEEVVAALSAPRSKPQEEGYPSIGRPRLRPEDEEELVKRLYVPRSKDSKVPEKESGPKPRRTVAEQRAYLDRLSKPKESEKEEDEDIFGQALGGLSFGQIAWPKFSTPCARLNKAETKKLGKGRKGAKGVEVKDSPLVQAGHMVLFDVSESVESECESPSRDSEAEAAEGEECRASTSSPTSPSGEDATGATGAQCSAPGASGQSGQMDTESTDEWLDRILGAPMPGPPRRSAKEQRERLEELAKPREKKERRESEANGKFSEKFSEKVSEPKSRSPRSQREACARLSQPRRPKDPKDPKAQVSQVSQVSHVQDTKSKEEMADDLGDLGDLDDLADLDDFEEESAGQSVHIIPSMLAQCSPRLERIDEEVEAREAREAKGASTRAARGHRGGSTPYSVPVCPVKNYWKTERPHEKPNASNSRMPSDRSDRSDRQTTMPSRPQDDLTPEELRQLATFLDTETDGDGEAMLEDIDALYSQLMGTEIEMADMEATAPTAAMASDPSDSPKNYGNGQAQATQAEIAESVGDGYGRPGPPNDQDDEVLLVAIDQLYHQMIPERRDEEKDERDRQGEEAEEAQMANRQIPAVSSKASPDAESEALEGCTCGNDTDDTDDTDDTHDTQLLEEVLWSALLIARAGHTAEVSELVSELIRQVPQIKAFWRSSSPALQQRLAAELPELCSSLCFAASVSASAAPSAALRKARDALLSLASLTDSKTSKASASSATDATASEFQLPTATATAAAAATAAKRKVRRTSLSHWTPESLEQLEAPKTKPSKAR